MNKSSIANMLTIFPAVAAANSTYATNMQALYLSTPSPKLLERGATKLDPKISTDDNGDTVPDVFDVCLGGADHTHIGN